ncbi:MAG TPA: DUF2852 domain-containing protein [Methylovirgula sp.]|nr:DUF2852 domain-containing protein [Methylovirgula sp.]
MLNKAAMEANMCVYSGPYATNEGARRAYFGWKPIEIIAMVLGFIVFWPIGLAILLAKIWQSRCAYPGDLPSFVQAKLDEKFREKREKWEQKMGQHWGCHRGSHDPSRWRRSSGNLAFDEWREAELTRLEEERQKLLAAEREFVEYMENLRRAKDREEFDRFMASRNRTQPPQPGA